MPAQNFNSLDELKAYIDAVIRANGNREIDGTEANNALIGLSKFIENSILNVSKAAIISTGGNVVLAKPFTVISVTTPTSLSWSQTNWHYEFYISNTTSNAIPLATGYSYLDVNLVQQNNIPAHTVIHIAKTTNNLWIQVNNVPEAITPIPLSIATQPTPQSVFTGAPASFTVIPTGGTQPYNFQWQKDTVDINGATSATLTISNSQSVNAGNYRVKITDSLGNEVISNAVSLSVNIPALSIATHPQSQSKQAGESVTFTVVPTGGVTPYGIQWQKDGVNISGATSSSYTINPVSGGSAGVFRAIVQDAASGSVTSNGATLTVVSQLVAKLAWTDTDPTANIMAGDTLTYQKTTNFVHNDNSIAFSLSGMPPDKFIVFMRPAGEAPFTNWVNTPGFNYGVVGPPDSIMKAEFSANGNTYIVSKVEATMDNTTTLTFSRAS